MKAKDKNLNSLFKNRSKEHNVESTTILFDQIEPFIVKRIQEATTIVGCIAWLSNPNILKCLQQTPYVDLIITSDKIPKSRKKIYKQIGTISILGLQTGRLRPLMHHKFIIGLSATGKPLFLLNGSYNFSSHSRHNLENIMCIRQPNIIKAYLLEYKRLKKKARKIR